MSGKLPLQTVGQLYAGLVAFGVSLALMVRARLGLSPWDVLNQGVARRFGIPLGWAVIVVGVLVLLAWVPLRQRPGFGTVSNVVVVGLAVDAAMAVLPAASGLAARWALLTCGVTLNALATALYVGAGLGPGPRDGLMTGLAARGHSLRVVRTAIEVTVLVAGWLLGGTVGAGTAVYAVTIGPLVHVLLPRLAAGRSAVALVPTRKEAGNGSHPCGDRHLDLCGPA